MRLLSACVLGAFCAAVGRGCNPGDVDLVVTVVNAHVRSADVGHGKSDPFVRVTIGEHTHHTSTIENNNHPEWDEELHYACANTSQPILVTVWDKDPVVANDLLVSNDWYDWSTVPQGVDLKLFDTGEDEENSEYYVTVRVVWTMEENCPSTCYGDYTCDYWDTNFGFLDGVCDKAGSDLSLPPASTLGACQCNGCACNQQNECAAHFTLQMTDAFGDGWSNNYWTWSTSAGAQLDSGTLATGSSGTAELCVFYEAFACYTFAVTDEGTYASEVSWSITDLDGAAEVAAGGAPGSAYICTDDLCDGDLLQVTMHDSFGDGWNGNSLEIRDCDGNTLAGGITLDQGTDGTARACVPTLDGYDVVVGGGTWQYEISWAVVDLSTGVDIASGGSPFEGGTCASPPVAEDDAAACSSSCMAYDCDWYDEHYGYTEGVCDYYGQDLSASGCDCSGCACDSGAAADDDGSGACAQSYTLKMYDESGDGWGAANRWKWSTEAGVLLSSGTLENGAEGSAELCMLYETFSCYVLSIDYDIDSWADEITWEVVQSSDGAVVASGDYQSTATLCTEELCDGDILAVAMHDSFGDGWNGNVMTLSGCPGSSLAGTTFADGLTVTEADGGVDKTRTVCVPAAAGGKFRVVVQGGSAPEEVSWEIDDSTPALSGGAPFDGGNCPGGGGGGDDDDGGGGGSSATCAADCIGQTCDYWNDNFGTNEADCDYYGSDMVQQYGCSCVGCGCLTSDCEKSYTLNMFDELGDGWHGATWAWAANIGLDTGTLNEGFATGSSDLCLYAQKFACYTLEVTAGEHKSAVSWQIATASGRVIQEGGAPATARVCDKCPSGNTVLEISLEDSFGDGWNGNELVISDCDSGEVLADGITMAYGHDDTQWACVETGYNAGAYAFKVSGGSDPDEIGFTVRDWLTETVLVTGDGNYNGGNCGAPAPANAPTRAPSALGSPTRSPYIWKTPKPTKRDDRDDGSSGGGGGGGGGHARGASGSHAAVVAVLVIFSVALVAGAGFYWHRKGAPVPGWCKKEPQLGGRYQNVGRWSFAAGAARSPGGGAGGSQPGEVVTFNALQREIAEKEMGSVGSGSGSGSGSARGSGGASPAMAGNGGGVSAMSSAGYASPAYVAPSAVSDGFDDDGGGGDSDDDSETMGV